MGRVVSVISEEAVGALTVEDIKEALLGHLLIVELEGFKRMQEAPPYVRRVITFVSQRGHVVDLPSKRRNFLGCVAAAVTQIALGRGPVHYSPQDVAEHAQIGYIWQSLPKAMQHTASFNHSSLLSPLSSPATEYAQVA